MYVSLLAIPVCNSICSAEEQMSGVRRTHRQVEQPHGYDNDHAADAPRLWSCKQHSLRRRSSAAWVQNTEHHSSWSFVRVAAVCNRNLCRNAKAVFTAPAAPSRPATRRPGQSQTGWSRSGSSWAAAPPHRGPPPRSRSSGPAAPGSLASGPPPPREAALAWWKQSVHVSTCGIGPK